MCPMLELSVIIAAYNEEFRLVPTLTRTTAFLRDRHIIFEILIVNDGSKDKLN